MPIKKIMTIKSGKFILSDKFSGDVLLPLSIELRILYETVKDLPILPSLAAQLEAELIRRSIFSTAAIEGNPLNEEDVGEIIEDVNREELKEIREIEIGNLKNAYDFTKELPVSSTPPRLNEDFIKEIHKILTQNIRHVCNVPGTYRNHTVKVGDKQHGGVYTPPKCLPDIQKLMKEYIEWINDDKILSLEIPVRAALAHYYLALVHPFGDGNGRTARIVEASLLRMSGIRYLPTMLSNFYYRNMDDYFIAFSISRKNKEFDITHFIEFVLKGCIDSLNSIKQKITFYIRKFTLRDYYDFLGKQKDITKRQNDLLILLLEKNTNFSFVLNELFTTSPFRFLYSSVSERTARRDLNKLKKMGLLVTSDNNKHSLNWRILDVL